MSEPGLVDVTGRLRSPAATPGHWAGCAPPNKGQRLPGRSADGRGDHPRHARGRTRPVRGQDACADRDSVARRAADQRSARPDGVRSGPEDRIGAGSRREGREAQDGRDGRLGVGPRRPLDRAPDPAADRSAVLHPRRPDPRRGWSATAARASSAGSRRRPGCAGGSRRTSSGTLTRSRCPTKGSRFRSSRGSSGMPTSGSRRSTCRESIPVRSSTRSTTAGRRSSRRAPVCDRNRTRRRARRRRTTSPPRSEQSPRARRSGHLTEVGAHDPKCPFAAAA